ncbi:hypothetical protein J7643_13225 [bacterium]|nr:hypothetical protein [bacterium]
MKLSSGLGALSLAALLATSGCAVLVPWRLAWGGWQEGIPHEPLLFKNVSDATARQAAAGALVGLKEKPFGLKDVRVVPAPASDSVLLMASLPFEPPSVSPETEGYYQGAVLPVFVKVRWDVKALTRFEVSSRIIRSPFKADWVDAYDATGSADATPAYLMRRASDLRTRSEAARMDEALDRLNVTLREAVTADLPWVVEEVAR